MEMVTLAEIFSSFLLYDKKGLSRRVEKLINLLSDGHGFKEDNFISQRHLLLFFET